MPPKLLPAGHRSQEGAGRTTTKLPMIHVPLTDRQRKSMARQSIPTPPNTPRGGHVEADLSRIGFRRNDQPMGEVYDAEAPEDKDNKAVIVARHSVQPLALELSMHIYPRKYQSGAPLPENTTVARFTLPDDDYTFEARVFREGWRVDIYATERAADGVSQLTRKKGS